MLLIPSASFGKLPSYGLSGPSRPSNLIFLPPRPAIRISLAVGAVCTADPTGALRVPLALLQPSLLTVIIFRSFLEPQINWKCFTSVGFFCFFFFFLIHLFLFPSTAQCSNVMGKLPR